MYSETEELMRSPESLVGKTIAERYQILEIIGQGGIGVVYKAQHTLMNRLVAIKMLRSESLKDERNWQRFQQEAQAISSMNHPNIVSIFDFGFNSNKSAFLVMDFLDGKDLDTVIQESGYLTPEEVVPIFTQICDALTETHERNIIHRDLKPGNIIIVKDGKKNVAKLVDFGMIKFEESDKRSQALTQPGEVFGSPYYMSPEQCTGMKLDARTDIYSMGILMYEALTGRPPFLGENMVELAKMHIYEKPSPMGSVISDKDFPEWMDRIVFKSLEKNAANRYQSTEELKEDLLAFNKFWLEKTGGESKPISLRQTTTSRRMKDEVMAAIKLAAEKQKSDGKAAATPPGSQAAGGSEGRAKAAPAAQAKASSSGKGKGFPAWVLVSAGVAIGGILVALTLTFMQPKSESKRWEELNDTGNYALKTGNLSEAEFNFSQAIQLAEKGGQTSSPAFYEALNGLASVYEKQNKSEMAESIYKQSLARIEKNENPNSANLAPVLIKIAALYTRLNRLDESEAMHKRAKEIIEKNFGETNPHMVECLREYAALRRKQGAESEAKDLERKADEMKSKLQSQSSSGPAK